MSIKKILVGGAAAVILLSNITIPAFAVVGLNLGFESGNLTDPFTQLNSVDITNLTNWDVNSGSIDYIGNYWQSSPVGGRSIDLNGVTAGSISQTITTTPGATYKVDFDMSGNPENSELEQYASPPNKELIVNATNGGSPMSFFFNTNTNGNTKENMMWETKQYTFVAISTNSVLSFSSNISGAFGPAIDNIVISEEVPTPTPNPYGIPEECSDIEGLGAPIVGTEGSEVLNGTNGPDLIFALGGSDVVNGKGGKDCIVGGDGSDALHGQGGNDVILGGNGSDAIDGQEGKDMLYGQDGSDSLKGGSGDDQMWGGKGTDSLKGDGGNDKADGGDDSDSCNAETETTCEV